MALELIKNQSIILDTCVLQYQKNQDIRSKLIQLLDLLKKNGNKIHFSEFSFYELFRGYHGQEKDELDRQLRSYSRYATDETIYRLAADLQSIYELEGVNRVSNGDPIIAATSVEKNTLVCTSNGNDFPRPFFEEIHVHDIYYKAKKRNKNLVQIYFLKPNIERIKFNLDKIQSREFFSSE